MTNLLVKKFSSFAQIPAILSLYPFQSISFQKLFADNFIKAENLRLLGIYEGNSLVAIANFEIIANEAVFIGMKPVLGNQELTDFGYIIINKEFVTSEQKVSLIWQIIINYFKKESVRQIRLDYVRNDSLVYKIYSKLAVKQQVSPFINLPSCWDDYLGLLDRIKRKELKRKLKRLATQNYSFVFSAPVNHENLEEFVRLHRLSDATKEKFMSADMKKFFLQMATAALLLPRAHLAFLRFNNTNVSSVLYFVTEDKQILLYNSGFDPQYGYYSVGLLLKALMIKTSIESGLIVFDFLRGNERYKYDLGAHDRILYQIKIKL